MIALCVGHSRRVRGRIEGGAQSVDGTSEWTYNDALAQEMKRLLTAAGKPCIVVRHYEGSTYTAAMRWLGRHLRERGATRAVELHFNAGGGTGHEWLYWRGSAGGLAMARALDERMGARFPELARRGTKPRGASDRGAGFLRATWCPAVIAEPFFGDSRADWKLALAEMEDIAEAMVDGLASC